MSAQTGGTTTSRAFNDAGQMTGESYAGGPLSGISVANVFDGLLRRTGVSALNSTTPLLQHSYAFSPTSGRLETVTDNLTPGTAHSAHYAYLANSPLVNQIVFKQNSTTRMTTTKSYDLLNRLTTISSASPSYATAGFTYAYNNAGQRYQVTHSDGGVNSFWQYGYDTLGQVTSGKHLMGGVPLAGQTFEYAFDTIGNRKFAKTGGEASYYPTTLRKSDYTVNALNQYTSRTVPGYVNILGVASNAAAKVWVNKLEPERHYGSLSMHFRKELTVDNTAGPVWLGVTNLAILNQGSNPDIIATNKGNVLVPMTPESFTYDLDGNQTSDSLWTNVWNGENRRVVIESSVSSGTGVPAVARAREVWTHLPDGRWIERIVSTNNGSSYVPAFTNRYVWDGNVLLAVLNNVNGLELSFMRGLDLSGTLQGAGGVGGLLAVFSPSAINSQPSTHFAAYDGNGNVKMLVNAADGTESARYETGPFAEPLRMTGPMAKVNPIRFSTQYANDVTGDLKYKHRDLDVGTGRWQSRDLIEERGGANLYLFVNNSACARIDPLGLVIFNRDEIARGNIVYSCNCGWLDREHFKFGGEFVNEIDSQIDLYELNSASDRVSLERIRTMLGGTVLAFGAWAQYQLVYQRPISTRSRVLLNLELMMRTSAIYEEAQGFYPNRVTGGFSVEDLPSNFVGALLRLNSKYPGSTGIDEDDLNISCHVLNVENSLKMFDFGTGPRVSNDHFPKLWKWRGSRLEFSYGLFGSRSMKNVNATCGDPCGKSKHQRPSFFDQYPVNGASGLYRTIMEEVRP